jgi:7-carboxy-7-deazaguanine synthase
MRCVWCDSEYTFTGGERISFDGIFDKLEEYGCGLVEVTGGEPLAQKNVFPFITELCDRGYEVLIETGGFVSIENVDPRAAIILDIKCPGSGEAERNHWPNLERLRPEFDEVKFVIADSDDLQFAKGIISQHRLVELTKAILISPVFGIDGLAAIASEVSKMGTPVRLNLQLHKYIWGADVHGV